MKDRINLRERLETARTMLREFEGRVKDLRRALVRMEQTAKRLEPQMRRAVDQTRTVGRGVRAGVRAGTASYRSGRRA